MMSLIVREDEESKSEGDGLTTLHQRIKDFVSGGCTDYASYMPYFYQDEARITSILNQAHAACYAEVNQGEEAAPFVSTVHDESQEDVFAWKLAFSVLLIAMLLLALVMAVALKRYRAEANAEAATSQIKGGEMV